MQGGRKMRCASCHHQWFQDNPDSETKAVDSDIAMDEIERPTKPALDVLKQDFRQGWGVMAAIIGVMLGLYFAISLFQSDMIMGQGLAFDRIAIERQESGELLLTGQIVNVMNEARGVPMIKITQILQSGAQGDSRIIDPMVESLNGGEVLPMSLMLQGIGEDVRDIKLTFEMPVSSP